MRRFIGYFLAIVLSAPAAAQNVSTYVDAVTGQKVSVSSANPLPVTGGGGGGGGEAHIGETGGNQTLAVIGQVVTAASAYAAGQAVGGLMTISNAARVNAGLGAGGTSGMIQSVLISAKSAQSSQIDVLIFRANPTASTCTDKTAVAIAAADFDKLIGVAKVTDWTPLGTPSLGQSQNLAIPYALASGTALYACAVTRATPTFASASDIAISFNALRN